MQADHRKWRATRINDVGRVCSGIRGPPDALRRSPSLNQRSLCIRLPPYAIAQIPFLSGCRSALRDLAQGFGRLAG